MACDVTDPAHAFRPWTPERTVEEMIGKPQTKLFWRQSDVRDGAGMRFAINGFDCS